MKRDSKQFGWLRLSVFTIAIALLASTAANASFLLADYHLGEADPGAVVGSNGNNPTIDSSGNAFNLPENNSPSPTYSSNTAPGTGSTISMSFPGVANVYYGQNAPITTAITTISMEAWAYPTGAPAVSGGYVVLNGDGASGYGFLDYQGFWRFIEPNDSFNTSIPVVLNQWVDLKLVLASNGTLTGYINGTLEVTQTTPAVTPSNLFFIGGGFNGVIDEVSVYTPEPASASILLVSGLAMIGRRRR